MAIGANCGVGASVPAGLGSRYRSRATPETTIVAKANCGIPVIRGENVVYTGTPELMSEYACLAIDAGAKIIGGCCGTSCDHLVAMRQAIDTHRKAARPSIATITDKIGPMVNSSAASQAISNKRSNRRRRA